MPPKQTVTIDAPTTAEFDALEVRVRTAEATVSAANEMISQLAGAISVIAQRVAALEPKPPPGLDRISFVPASDELVSPVLKGMAIGAILVEPGSWSGQLEVGGADADFVGIDDQRRLIAAQDIKDAREYEVIVTALL